MPPAALAPRSGVCGRCACGAAHKCYPNVLWRNQFDLTHSAGEPSCVAPPFLRGWHTFLDSVQRTTKSKKTEEFSVKVGQRGQAVFDEAPVCRTCVCGHLHSSSWVALASS